MSRDPNINTVELAAAALGALLDDFVLVGGCAVGLLVTDQARALVRHTIDVDQGIRDVGSGIANVAGAAWDTLTGW